MAFPLCWKNCCRGNLPQRSMSGGVLTELTKKLMLCRSLQSVPDRQPCAALCRCLLPWQAWQPSVDSPRTSWWRFFRHISLEILEIPEVFLRLSISSDETITRQSAHAESTLGCLSVDACFPGRIADWSVIWFLYLLCIFIIEKIEALSRISERPEKIAKTRGFPRSWKCDIMAADYRKGVTNLALTIQERIKDLRVEKGLTLEQLAEETGLSRSIPIMLQLSALTVCASSSLKQSVFFGKTTWRKPS